MLELMHALEKNMFSAYAGSCLRPMALASAAVAFYKSNRKVRKILACLLTLRSAVRMESRTVGRIGIYG